MIANVIKRYIDSGQVVHVTTKLGTDLRFYKRNRYAGFFNGDVKAGRGFSSASIEIYVAIEETETTGTLILDGSLGYIGKVEKPFRIEIRNGQITEIEQTPDGKRLKEYLESFEDERMYIAAELGIGLNYLSKCEGNCYIEDESSYGTFHIGFGRNVALGGVQEACSHFDLVTFEPDIFVDNRKIIEEGRVIIPEPQVY
jgi:leucyl aminopeptidase (aminopeptidase T)